MITSLFGWLAIALTCGGGAALVWLLLGKPDDALTRYIAAIARDLRFIRSKRSAARIVTSQAFLFTLLVAAGTLVDARLFYVAVVSLLLPPLALRWRVRKRRDRMVEQVDSWLVMLANMLRATGSLADALASTVRLTSAPLSEEVDLVVTEIDLGEQIDVALRNMIRRVDRSLFSAAITGLLVGRQTGGDLPVLLEHSAAAIREIARLEGVVRSKTAQGKMQLAVMVLFPPLLYYGLQSMDPHFFDPLTGFVGVVIYSIASVLWLGGILLARKILAVDV